MLSERGRLEAEQLPLYRSGAEANRIRQMLESRDRQRAIAIQKIADDLGISTDHAEALYDMSERRARGTPE